METLDHVYFLAGPFYCEFKYNTHNMLQYEDTKDDATYDEMRLSILRKLTTMIKFFLVTVNDKRDEDYSENVEKEEDTCVDNQVVLPSTHIPCKEHRYVYRNTPSIEEYYLVQI